MSLDRPIPGRTATQSPSRTHDESTILSVEDDAPSRAVISGSLKHYTVAFAGSGADAIIRINSDYFDLLVLDKWLPDYDGVGICREVRQRDPYVPIVFWTMADRVEVQARAMRAGASAYLQKAPDYAVLQDTVARLLRASRDRVARAEAAAHSAMAELREHYLRANPPDETAGRIDALVVRFGERRARAAFTGAGGTLAQFRRWWTRWSASRT